MESHAFAPKYMSGKREGAETEVDAQINRAA